jgi:hypothetical protein
MKLLPLLLRATLTAAIAVLGASAAHAAGSLVEVNIVERDGGGAASPLHSHSGRWHVAGRPGARYAIRLRNNSGERVLAVMSVDGVNIITGRSASFEQSGYVLGPWETHEITGWRKSASEVAAFYFTALGDSYAARTGRPEDVGVIGVALFKERVMRPLGRIAPPVTQAAPRAEADAGTRAGTESERMARADRSQAARDSSDEPGSAAGAAATAPAAPAPSERLGTGHGEREASYSRHTTFARSTRHPVEVVSIFYDSFENLARAGVIAAPPPIAQRRPNPFPHANGYVPDPPRY